MRKYYLVFYTGKEMGEIVNDVIPFTGRTTTLNKSELIQSIVHKTQHYNVSLTNIIEITKDDYQNWDK